MTAASLPPSSAFVIVCVLAVVSAGCASRGLPASQMGQASTSDVASNQTRALVIAVRSEPDSLSSRPLLRPSGAGNTTVDRLFTAGLALQDSQGSALPYLAEALPHLHSASWRVFPDGRMETTYRLKPGLVWHDGVRLTAEDIVFAWRVFATPSLGAATLPPIPQIEEVVAQDERSVVVLWRQPFPEANELTERELQPLPRHILEEGFQALSGGPEAFAARPYWTTEYVGLGPYRLERWEPGAFLEGVAFDGHALGQPRIERVRVRFIADPNTVVANLLAEELHLATDDAILSQQWFVLRREWSTRDERRRGIGLVVPSEWRRAEAQHRPEYASPRSILDVRVRKALAHALDREALNDALFEGQGVLADSVIPPTVDYYPVVDRAVAKYPFDLRRAEQLMAQAGFTKGADGYASPSEGRFSFEMKANATADFATEVSIMASGWRQLGFDAQETIVPLAQARDGQVRGAFPAFYVGGGSAGHDQLPRFTTANISLPETRWLGSNRAGWTNPEYDRLAEALTGTLDRGERSQHVAHMVRLFSEDVAAISIYFNPTVTAHLAGLQGPQRVTPGVDPNWNVHEWTWR